MEALQTRIGMPIEEFLAEAHHRKFEILAGEKVVLMPNASRHAKLLVLIYDAIRDFLRANPIGHVFPEATFILPDYNDPNWVRGSRIPDVMFVTNATWDAYEDSPLNIDERPFAFIPDLAVEIVSPTDIYSDVSQKVGLYLADGVRFVWIVDYRTQRVDVYSEGSIQRLGIGDTLTGDSMLPGFEIPLAGLFSV